MSTIQSSQEQQQRKNAPSSSLRGKKVLITGASMGIGSAIAQVLAAAGANLILFSRTERGMVKSKLAELSEAIRAQYPSVKVFHEPVDIQDYDSVNNAVERVVRETGDIDILVNNAGLALGTPAIFSDLKIADILQMNNTNILGMQYVTYAVLNHSFNKKKAGTILNVSSTTALEAPPFPGEAVYHASKAFQEGFSNALRNELTGTDIRVLVLRPGVVRTHFHEQRVGFDDGKFDSFMDGFTPLEAEEIARGAVFMLEQPLHISIKALDIVPTAQRSLTVFDRKWNQRRKTDNPQN